MATSPTQLSLKKLRAEGYLVSITEKFNHFCKIRQDMWGWCDLLAIKEDEVLAVQTTSYTNISARVKKIADSDTIGIVRKANIKVNVHGWRKVGSRWECKVIDVS
jgi:hypothetical protein